MVEAISQKKTIDWHSYKSMPTNVVILNIPLIIVK